MTLCTSFYSFETHAWIKDPVDLVIVKKIGQAIVAASLVAVVWARINFSALLLTKLQDSDKFRENFSQNLKFLNIF